MDFLKTSVQEFIELGLAKHQEYSEAKPFPNIYFDDFFNPDMLREVLAEFPELGDKPGDIHYANPNESKYASKGESRFGPKTLEFAHFLNSEPFLEFLQNLTGIKETLIPDPYFEGGGFHQIKPGGFLKTCSWLNNEGKLVFKGDDDAELIEDVNSRADQQDTNDKSADRKIVVHTGRFRRTIPENGIKCELKQKVDRWRSGDQGGASTTFKVTSFAPSACSRSLTSRCISTSAGQPENVGVMVTVTWSPAR